MSYQVLARKYRPQSFEEIIGQSHVATTLMNALRQQKVAHAYLFSGPRGVGKTTAARILAKALNCAKGPTSTPCNECDSCLRIAQGQEMVDVLEIDAASNRGIEEIRELRDNVRYAPARGRYKVYIVDEAHQITHDAFNAFLKTLEEPPEHAVFVLATTEHQKIPATILSRCQLFRFRRVSVEDITTQLGKILAQEKIEVEPEALTRLARAAGGSVRDGLSLLDQALAYATGKLTAKQVEVLLGFLPEEFLQGFASALLERKPQGVLQWIQQLAEEGWDLPQFIRDFREFLRGAITDQISKGVKPEALELAGRPASLAEILQIIRVMGQCIDEMRWNDNPRLVLELYSLRLTQPFVDAGALLRRIEELERHGMGGAAAGAASETDHRTPIKPATATAPRSDIAAPSAAGLSSPQSSAPPSPASPSPAPPIARPSASTQTEVAAQWKQLLAELWKKPAVAAHMERARLRAATANEWVVAFGDKFALDSAQRAVSLIAEIVAKIAGHPIALRFIQESGAAAPEESSVIVAPVEEERMAAASQDVKVQKILEMFKGKIRLPDEERP